MKRLYYLVSLLFVCTLPAIIVAFFVWDRIPLLNLALFVIGIVVFGSIWDIWATPHGKRDKVWLWQFHEEETLGVKLFSLPIEEYLFFMSTSLYIVFLWEGIRFALETQNMLMYIVIPFAGVWSLVCILIPYKLKMKGDRVL